MWPRQHAEAQTVHQNGGKNGLCGCWWQTGWSEYLLGLSLKKRANIQRAAVVWMKMLCWCEMSEVAGPTTSRWYNWGIAYTISERTTNPTLKTKGYSSRSPHQSKSCVLRTGTGGNNSCLASIVQAACGGVMVLGILSWHTCLPL